MDIDLPDVVAEVKAAFDRYEKALMTNDVAYARRVFRKSIRAPSVMERRKYSMVITRSPHSALRVRRSDWMRTLSRTVIHTYGCDFAVANTLFHRTTAPGKVGRQTQAWVRFDDGWYIVTGHVSVIDEASVWKPA